MGALLLFSCMQLGSAQSREFIGASRPFVDSSGATVMRETYRDCKLSGWQRGVCWGIAALTPMCDPERVGVCREVIEVRPAPTLPPCESIECAVTRSVERFVSFAEYAGRNPLTV